MALPERRRLGHTLLAPGSDRRRQLRGVGVAVGLAGRQLQSARELPVTLDAELHRRRLVHGSRVPPNDCRARRRDGRDALDISRAQHQTLGRVHAGQLRQGRRLRGSRWTGRRLRNHAGVLPPCVGRQDRRASRRLRHAGRYSGLPGDGCRRPSRGSGLSLRSGAGTSPGDRIHHEFLAPDRGERNRRRGQFTRAGIQPDSNRERSRPHPRLRRRNGRSQVEVQRHPAVGE